MPNIPKGGKQIREPYLKEYYVQKKNMHIEGGYRHVHSEEAYI